MRFRWTQTGIVSIGRPGQGGNLDTTTRSSSQQLTDQFIDRRHLPTPVPHLASRAACMKPAAGPASTVRTVMNNNDLDHSHSSFALCSDGAIGLVARSSTFQAAELFHLRINKPRELILLKRQETQSLNQLPVR